MQYRLEMDGRRDLEYDARIEASRATLIFNSPMGRLNLQGTQGKQPGLFDDGHPDEDLWGWK